MWLLTCDGDIFGHKPIWLRPGSGHLLGRTSGRAEGGEVVRYINHKSVSRKHAIIHVGHVKQGDSARLHARSEIKITDGSKVGTYINGEKISQTSKILDKTEYTIKLGNYEHEFHLQWRPVVFTFTNLSKSAKARSDPLGAQRQKLEPADIKIITEYISSQTTHVIGKKRNTSPGLQALLQGRWLLADSFVDAMAKATAKPGANGGGNELPCPLEEDLEKNWPQEEDHILAAGAEPNPRPNDYLKPNAERAELFAHLTFIFLSQHQHDLLMPVVTSGGGKALLWDVAIGSSKADDLIGFVKEVAGAKGDRTFRLSQPSGNGGIVLVRPGDKESQWTVEFLAAVETTLEQRSMEQNQFLEAILSADISELRKPLTRESQSQVAAAASLDTPSQSRSSARDRNQRKSASVEAQASDLTQHRTRPDSEQPQENSEAMNSRPNKKMRRTVTQSRFKGFEEVDPSQFTRPESESPELSQPPPEDEAMQVDEPSQPEPSQPAGRKRAAPDEDDYGPERQRAMMDNLLPGAAAMKKRRLQNKENAAGGSSNATPEPELPAAVAKKTEKKAKLRDVRAEIEARHKREEEARLKDEEALREALNGVDISDVRAKVESFDVAPREPPRRPQHEDAGPSDRWDPAWNGRKNFKRFKRRGQNGEGPRLPRVIVGLEEEPRKGHGIGEEYWLYKTNSSTRSTARAKSQSQSQPQTQTSHENGDDDPTRFRRRIQNSIREDEEADDIVAGFPEESTNRSRACTTQEASNSTPSQTLGTESQRRAAGKRPATQHDGPAPKRTKQTRPTPSRETVTLDDDDDDALKFRRRRR